jgi:hypothetical protein
VLESSPLSTPAPSRKRAPAAASHGSSERTRRRDRSSVVATAGMHPAHPESLQRAPLMRGRTKKMTDRRRHRRSFAIAALTLPMAIALSLKLFPWRNPTREHVVPRVVSQALGRGAHRRGCGADVDLRNRHAHDLRVASELPDVLLVRCQRQYVQDVSPLGPIRRTRHHRDSLHRFELDSRRHQVL